MSCNTLELLLETFRQPQTAKWTVDRLYNIGMLKCIQNSSVRTSRELLVG